MQEKDVVIVDSLSEAPPVPDVQEIAPEGDPKEMINKMLDAGQIDAEQAANLLRMFSGKGANRRQFGKHSIARAQRAKFRIAARKKKR